jgi:hypothetical protein
VPCVAAGGGGESLDDCEPEPCACRLFRGARERLEEPRDEGLRDAGAGVADAYRDDRFVAVDVEVVEGEPWASALAT